MKTVEIDHFKQYRSVLNLKAGPGALSFLERWADDESDSYVQRLCLWHNGHTTALTAADVQGYWWHGQDIVFSSVRKAQDKEVTQRGVPLTVLYKISTETPGEAQEFARLPYSVSDITFLPSGDFLFVAEHDALLHTVQTRRAGDTGKVEQLLQREADYNVFTELPFWQNGAGPCSGKRQRLYLWQHDIATPLTDEKTEVEHLRLAPDGQHAYYIATSRTAGASPLHNRLMRLDIAAKKAEDISFENPFCHRAFALLPSGDVLVFGSDLKQYGINQNSAVYLLDTTKKTARMLDNGDEYGEGCLSLSDIAQTAPARVVADGEGGVLYHAALGGHSHLLRIDTRSGAIISLTKQPGCVLEYALLDGEIYLSALRGLGGAELYHLQLDGGETRLSSFNSRLSRQYAYVAPQPLAFTNAEGVRIEGWVMYPADLEPGKTYPALLNIHGGPKGAYSPGMFHEMQLLASRGYGVMFCNPTGSDGRGNAFGDLRGRYGSVDYDDLMGFVDTALAAHRWIDPRRLGVLGGSYGGFMTNWVIGHTTRFAAAVSMRGISNWFTMASTTDIGRFFTPDQTGIDMWAQPNALWDASPLKYAPQAKTPTLFIHAEQDYRCWMVESLQMFSALQQFGVPSRLCLFKAENHELSRSGKPSHRVRRLQEMLDWFDTYLK